jgi:hypothetical protein
MSDGASSGKIFDMEAILMIISIGLPESKVVTNHAERNRAYIFSFLVQANFEMIKPATITVA